MLVTWAQPPNGISGGVKHALGASLSDWKVSQIVMKIRKITWYGDIQNFVAIVVEFGAEHVVAPAVVISCQWSICAN